MEPTAAATSILRADRFRLQDLIGTKLKTRLLKEMRPGRGRQPPQVHGAGTRRPTTAQGGLVYWDTDTDASGRAADHVAPTREPDGSGVRGHQRSRATCRRSPTGELVEPASTSTWKASYEVTLADGTKHIARPVWELLAKSVAEYTPEWASRDHRSRPAAHRGGVHGVGHAPRAARLRQRRHPPTTWRPSRSATAHQNGARGAQPHGHHSGNFDGPAGNRGLSRTPVDEQATAAPGTNMPQEVKWTLKGMEALTGQPMCPPMYLADKQVDPMNIPDRREVLGNMIGARSSPFCRTTTSGPTPPAFGRHASARASTR